MIINNIITMLDGLVKMDADSSSINADAADISNAANIASSIFKNADTSNAMQPI